MEALKGWDILRGRRRKSYPQQNPAEYDRIVQTVRRQVDAQRAPLPDNYVDLVNHLRKLIDVRGSAYSDFNHKLDELSHFISDERKLVEAAVKVCDNKEAVKAAIDLHIGDLDAELAHVKRESPTMAKYRAASIRNSIVELERKNEELLQQIANNKAVMARLTKDAEAAESEANKPLMVEDAVNEVKRELLQRKEWFR